MTIELGLDCKHYLGDRPCRFRQRCRCAQYEPMGHRILIIKLGALGDVVRTACLLPTLKRLHPQSHVTWISKPSGVRILKGHPLIDMLLPFDAEGILTVSQQSYDLVISLDKEAGPIALCNAVSSPDKRGIKMSAFGTPEPGEERCEMYFSLGLDDELKFRHNVKTYPELVHEALGLPCRREPYFLPCDEATLAWARARAHPWRACARGQVIGLNVGAGDVFANKVPAAGCWIEVASQLRDLGYGVVLLGGPGEAKDMAGILQAVGPGIWPAGCDNSESQFVGIVDQCDVVAAGDTLGMHVAVARRVPVVALFGPTCQQEIDLFDLGTKIVSPCECGPCYRRRCDTRPSCMDMISADRIVAEVTALAGTRPGALEPTGIKREGIRE